MKLDLDKKLKIKQIARENGILLAVAFGSKAKGKQRVDSDLDIAVLTSKKPTYQLFGELFGKFSQIFKKENVDLRFLNEADPFFRHQVSKNGVLLFGNQHQYNLFKMYAYRSFIDDGRKYFPYLEKSIKEKQNKLEENL